MSMYVTEMRMLCLKQGLGITCKIPVSFLVCNALKIQSAVFFDVWIDSRERMKTFLLE